MELTLREFVDAEIALDSLTKNPNVPALASYKIAKNVKLITNETEAYWEVRKNLLKPFANDKGKIDYPDLETQEKVSSELDEVLSQKVKVDIKAINIKMLEKVNVAPTVFHQAWFLFKD